MGRQLKKVALDFEWPINKTWDGYINPHYAKCHKCHACDGTGATVAHQRLQDLTSLLMLSGDDARRGACHPYFEHAPLYRTEGKTPGKDMIELTTGLAERALSFLGHDACDKWRAVKKVIAAAGLPEEWGNCPSCDGSGEDWESSEAEHAAENWRPQEPPAGPGFQIWETVSEGSPISPVFASAEALAAYMAGRPWGADNGSSYGAWMALITGPGWALSAVSSAQGVKTGAEAAPIG